ncbi:hypothetical protein EA004_26910, partial [Vibrio anguillarum]|nr:hypothetical protein [Vibrio anguillarum]
VDIAFEFTPKAEARYHLNTDITLVAETLWAPAGHVSASEQFALHNTAGLAMPKLETQPAPAITQQKGMIVVTSLDEKHQWCWDS